jgi:rhamnogalacturonyl hydrolase YesR
MLRAGGAAALAAAGSAAVSDGARGAPTRAAPASPVGRYRPELLLLAPEGGEDANTRSLLAQFLELGVAVELDAGWRLPTVPPRDLSAYKVCIFPESARARYDADLDAFYRGGGYLGYFKYYPLAGAEAGGVHHYLTTYGRDAYFFHVANVLLEGGLGTRDPDFGAALAARPAASMIPDCRALFFGAYGARTIERWEAWGDTTYTQLLAHLLLAAARQDREWADLARWCLGKIEEAVPRALAGAVSETRALVDTPSIGLPMLGEVLMRFGEETGAARTRAAGLELARHFVDHAGRSHGVLSSRYMRLLWSESLMPVPGLYWAARVSGERRYAALADALVRKVTASNQRADGLWHHWSDGGAKGSCWSRGCGWPVLAMTQALDAVDPGGASAAFMRAAIDRTFDGLARHQEPNGWWHLIVDEPGTRPETSGAAILVYCHDRLRALGAGQRRHDAMFERAFTGLKRLHYGGGLAASCRGTATGTPEYYRTRPLGYYDRGLWPAALATRA